MASGLGLILVLVGVIVVLVIGSAQAWRHFGFSFLVGRDWDPVHQRFGALPAIYGTIVTSAIAIVFAVPVAVGLSILINESAPPRLAGPLAAFVEVLAAIPSVVYGLWGLAVFAPFVEKNIEPGLRMTLGKVPLIGQLFHGTPAGGDIFTAGLILSIMILPIVTAISREVIATVPTDLREAAKSLGATRWETMRLAVLPHARGGIVGAALLGLGRALGETIAVAMVIGGGRNIGLSLFQPGSTIPSVLASQYLNAQDALQRSSLLALAVIPALKLTDLGLVDVDRFRIVPLFGAD